MKTIKQDELYQNLSEFLSAKGIEFKDGVYTKRVSRACGLLTDAINETQRTMKCAKLKVDQKLDQLRHTIHEATAPKATVNPAAAKKKAARAQPKRKAAARKKARSN